MVPMVLLSVDAVMELLMLRLCQAIQAEILSDWNWRER
jgi:hypothetical protein